MTINVNQQVKDLSGHAVRNTLNGDDLLSLRSALLLALARGDDASTKFTPEDAIGRADLALKIYNAEKDVQLKVEDIVLLKKLTSGLIANVGFNPIVAGLILKMLDPVPNL